MSSVNFFWFLGSMNSIVYIEVKSFEDVNSLDKLEPIQLYSKNVDDCLLFSMSKNEVSAIIGYFHRFSILLDDGVVVNSVGKQTSF
jgi:hypothetical protein